MSKDKFRKNNETGRTSSRKSGSRKKNTKSPRKEERFDEEAIKGKTRAANDPSWYGAGTALMKDAASLPFANFAGLPISLKDSNFTSFTSELDDFIIPGIMQFDVVPTFGEMKDWSSPFNVAVRDMYSFIRHANSGHANYDASDLGMYLLTYDSALTYYAWMVRLYGLMRTVMAKNRYLPSVIIEACGGDYSDLVTHMANFRYYINAFAARLRAMRIPDTFSSVQRHMWLFSNVFLDAPVEKAQMYLLRPAGFWTYNEFASNPKDVFILTPLVTGGMTLDDIIMHGDYMLNSILNNESFNIMSGDVIKAYGDRTFTCNPISEEYSVIPTFEPEFLMQIHNATIVAASEYTKKWRIYESTDENDKVGSLISNFTVGVGDTSFPEEESNVYLYLRKIIDLPIESPTSVDVAIATRFAVAMDNYKPVNEGLSGEGVLSAFGTEVIVNAAVVGIERGKYKVLASVNNPSYTPNLEMFGSHPYVVRPVWDDEEVVDVKVYGDFDNYTTITHDTLSNIHKVAILSMFGMNK